MSFYVQEQEECPPLESPSTFHKNNQDKAPHKHSIAQKMCNTALDDSNNSINSTIVHLNTTIELLSSDNENTSSSTSYNSQSNMSTKKLRAKDSKNLTYRKSVTPSLTPISSRRSIVTIDLLDSDENENTEIAPTDKELSQSYEQDSIGIKKWKKNKNNQPPLNKINSDISSIQSSFHPNTVPTTIAKPPASPQINFSFNTTQLSTANDQLLSTLSSSRNPTVNPAIIHSLQTQSNKLHQQALKASSLSVSQTNLTSSLSTSSSLVGKKVLKKSSSTVTLVPSLSKNPSSNLSTTSTTTTLSTILTLDEFNINPKKRLAGPLGDANDLQYSIAAVAEQSHTSPSLSSQNIPMIISSPTNTSAKSTASIAVVEGYPQMDDLDNFSREHQDNHALTNINHDEDQFAHLTTNTLLPSTLTSFEDSGETSSVSITSLEQFGDQLALVNDFLAFFGIMEPTSTGLEMSSNQSNFLDLSFNGGLQTAHPFTSTSTEPGTTDNSFPPPQTDTTQSDIDLNINNSINSSIKNIGELLNSLETITNNLLPSTTSSPVVNKDNNIFIQPVAISTPISNPQSIMPPQPQAMPTTDITILPAQSPVAVISSQISPHNPTFVPPITLESSFQDDKTFLLSPTFSSLDGDDFSFQISLFDARPTSSISSFDKFLSKCNEIDQYMVDDPLETTSSKINSISSTLHPSLLPAIHQSTSNPCDHNTTSKGNIPQSTSYTQILSNNNNNNAISIFDSIAAVRGLPTQKQQLQQLHQQQPNHQQHQQCLSGVGQNPADVHAHLGADKVAHFDSLVNKQSKKDHTNNDKNKQNKSTTIGGEFDDIWAETLQVTNFTRNCDDTDHSEKNSTDDGEDIALMSQKKLSDRNQIQNSFPLENKNKNQRMDNEPITCEDNWSSFNKISESNKDVQFYEQEYNEKVAQIIRCKHCHGVGHTQNHCTYNVNYFPCSVCGTPGHASDSKCPGRFCYLCLRKHPNDATSGFRNKSQCSILKNRLIAIYRQYQASSRLLQQQHQQEQDPKEISLHHSAKKAKAEQKTQEKEDKAQMWEFSRNIDSMTSRGMSQGGKDQNDTAFSCWLPSCVTIGSKIVQNQSLLSTYLATMFYHNLSKEKRSMSMPQSYQSTSNKNNNKTNRHIRNFLQDDYQTLEEYNNDQDNNENFANPHDFIRIQWKCPVCLLCGSISHSSLECTFKSPIPRFGITNPIIATTQQPTFSSGTRTTTFEGIQVQDPQNMSKIDANFTYDDSLHPATNPFAHIKCFTCGYYGHSQCAGFYSYQKQFFTGAELIEMNNNIDMKDIDQDEDSSELESSSDEDSDFEYFEYDDVHEKKMEARKERQQFHAEKRIIKIQHQLDISSIKTPQLPQTNKYHSVSIYNPIKIPGSASFDRACTLCVSPSHLAQNCPNNLGYQGCNIPQALYEPRFDIYSQELHCITARVIRGRASCYICSRPGHHPSSCPNRKCFLCNQSGHDKSSCPNRRGGYGGYGNRSGNNNQRNSLPAARDYETNPQHRSSGDNRKSFSKSDIMLCFVCKKPGHKAHSCPDQPISKVDKKLNISHSEQKFTSAVEQQQLLEKREKKKARREAKLAAMTPEEIQTKKDKKSKSIQKKDKKDKKDTKEKNDTKNSKHFQQKEQPSKSKKSIHNPNKRSKHAQN